MVPGPKVSRKKMSLLKVTTWTEDKKSLYSSIFPESREIVQLVTACLANITYPYLKKMLLERQRQVDVLGLPVGQPSLLGRFHVSEKPCTHPQRYTMPEQHP